MAKEKEIELIPVTCEERYFVGNKAFRSEETAVAYSGMLLLKSLVNKFTYQREFALEDLLDYLSGKPSHQKAVIETIENWSKIKHELY